ncbi:chemokine (C-X-C motif) ligand 18b [Notolabrus celidotus]|uniref:chemokine (C-X-C motif) ligand 18b n=1 Tax=Notolabrus celidotus TaxID=1203425 RepID=UPI0014906742|nr:chemokine (C-X-C motif) ligand 18b [Notolabrus celidotus]
MGSGKTHSVLAIKGNQAHSSSSLSLLSLPQFTLSPSRDLWTFVFLQEQKMALISKKNCAFLLVVVAAVYIQLYQATHDIPDRCYCPEVINFIKGNMSDFQVYDRRSGCDKTELIVTMNKLDNTTEKLCMNTQKKFGMAFVKCWDRINRTESRKSECIDKMKRAV